LGNPLVGNTKLKKRRGPIPPKGPPTKEEITPTTSPPRVMLPFQGKREKISVGKKELG